MLTYRQQKPNEYGHFHLVRCEHMKINAIPSLANTRARSFPSTGSTATEDQRSEASPSKPYPQ